MVPRHFCKYNIVLQKCAFNDMWLICCCDDVSALYVLNYVTGTHVDVAFMSQLIRYSLSSVADAWGTVRGLATLCLFTLATASYIFHACHVSAELAAVSSPVFSLVHGRLLRWAVLPYDTIADDPHRLCGSWC